MQSKQALTLIQNKLLVIEIECNIAVIECSTRKCQTFQGICLRCMNDG